MSIKTILHRILRDEESFEPKIRDEVRKRALAQTVSNCGNLSLIFSAVFIYYGFTSYDFIHYFSKEVHLFQNVGLRSLCCSVPFLALSWYMKKGKTSDLRKLYIWAIVFGAIMDVASCIYVWPAALAGNSEIMAIVNAANVFLFAVIYSVLAPPNRYVLQFSGLVFVTFCLPLFLVLFSMGNSPHALTIRNLLINDTQTALLVGTCLSCLGHARKVRILRNEIEISPFVHKRVVKAIKEEKYEKLREVRESSAFVIFIDIRNSTKMLTANDEGVSKFLGQYQKLLSRTAGNFGGETEKFMGDGHVITFGLDEPDLSDIEDLDLEVKEGIRIRNKQLFGNAHQFLNEIFTGARQIYSSCSLEEKFGVLRFGAAIDYGKIKTILVGDEEHRLESDISGNTIIRCKRLEAYTKEIGRFFEKQSSLLIISPTVNEYVPAIEGLRTIRAPTDSPVKDFPGICEFFVKEFPVSHEVFKSGGGEAA